MHCVLPADYLCPVLFRISRHLLVEISGYFRSYLYFRVR